MKMLYVKLMALGLPIAKGPILCPMPCCCCYYYLTYLTHPSVVLFNIEHDSIQSLRKYINKLITRMLPLPLHPAPRNRWLASKILLERGQKAGDDSFQAPRICKVRRMPWLGMVSGKEKCPIQSTPVRPCVCSLALRCTADLFPMNELQQMECLWQIFDSS